jgi:hypothetical protein
MSGPAGNFPLRAAIYQRDLPKFDMAVPQSDDCPNVTIGLDFLPISAQLDHHLERREASPEDGTKNLRRPSQEEYTEQK